MLAQQVMMTRLDLRPGDGELVDVDKWAGYEFERRAVWRHLHDCGVANPVVRTGDVHKNWANELTRDFDREAGARQPVAVELVGTSITSGGDGVDRPDYFEQLGAENPAVKYHNSERGYVRCEVTPRQWRTDFRTVPYVSRPGAPLQTRASWVVEDGRSKLERA
ncbi:MAG: alkaline phosphatase D family protein [Candidatus Synoicihabitans palmerolidicus]|nr:alkaline phosphatase D family protein [Candidatus Synoicihabitans palmerolidicus]